MMPAGHNDELMPGGFCASQRFEGRGQKRFFGVSSVPSKSSAITRAVMAFSVVDVEIGMSGDGYTGWTDAQNLPALFSINAQKRLSWLLNAEEVQEERSIHETNRLYRQPGKSADPRLAFGS